MVSLTLFYTSQASSITNAAAAGSASGGTQGNGTLSLSRPTAPTYLEMRKATGLALSSTLPATASTYGQILDSTLLEGKTLTAGTWTGTFSFKYTGVAVTGRPWIQVFKRSGAGVYTSLGSGNAGADVALTTSYVAKTITFSIATDTLFTTGDKLYFELYFVNSARPSTGTDSIEWYLATTTTGVTTAQLVTPGYTTTPVTSTRVVTGVSAAVKALDVERPVVSVSGAVKALNISKNIGSVSAAVSTPSAYAQAVLADSPIRYYRMDDASGSVLTDISGSGQNGTILSVTYGASSLLVTDAGNKAMSFASASSNYITIPTSGLPSGGAAYSLEAWITMSTIPGGGHYPIVLNLGNATAHQEVNIYFDGDLQQLRFGYKGDSQIPFGSLPGVGTVYHVVGTFDGTTLTFYVNGVLQNTATPVSSNITYGIAYIGNSDELLYWDGTIDEVAIYATCLSSTQVQTHYTAGSSTVATRTRPITAVSAAVQALGGPRTITGVGASVAIGGTYFFGTLGATAAHAATEAADGLGLAEVDVSWDAYETADGVFSSSYASTINTQVTALRAAGLPVVLGLALHYTPSWVFSIANSSYINQFGSTYGQANLIFNKTLRQKAEALISRIDADIGLSNFYAIRISSGGDAEILYPDEGADGVHGNGYWAYDANAQGTGGNLPTTLSACPYPGWHPGDTTWNSAAFTSAQTQTWYDWYQGALADVVNWQIQTYKTLGYHGKFYTLTPGRGASPSQYTWAINHLLDGTDWSSTLGRGAVWHAFYDALPDTVNVTAYCSSVADTSGSPPENMSTSGDESVLITDAQIDSWSSIRLITYAAHRNGMAVSGENPGGGGTYGVTMLNAAFAHIVASKIQDFYWARESNLFGGGGNISIDDYASAIKTVQAGHIPRVIVGISASVAPTAVTHTRTMSGISAAVQTIGATRPVVDVSVALSSSAPFVLYGSSVPDGSVTTACEMASGITGGGEVTSTTTIAGTANTFAEIYAQGSASGTSYASIPATPPWHGWVFQPGAGTFAAGNWQASITLGLATFGVNRSVTIRYFKRVNASTFTLIGTSSPRTLTAAAKTTYTMPVVSGSSITFGATDLVYVDLFYSDTTSNVGGDNPIIYLSTSASAGVANDMQVTTPAFTPASGAVTSTRSITGVSAAVQALGVTRNVTGMSVATQALGLTRPVVSVSGATQALGLTRPVVSISVSLVFTGSRPIGGVSSALLASQVARPVVNVSTSPLLFTGSRPITGVSGATKALGVERGVIGVSGSVGAGGISRTIIGVGAALQALSVPRPIAGVSAATLQSDVRRTISTVSTAVSASYSRPISGVSAAMLQPGITRPITSVSTATLQPGIARSLVSISSAIQALGVIRPLTSVSTALVFTGKRPITGVSTSPLLFTGSRSLVGVSAATQALGVTRPIANVSGAVGVGGVTRSITGVSAATKALGVIRTISGISGATIQVGITRPLSPISASVSLTRTRTISGVSSALKALGVERPLITVSAATKAFGVTRPLSGITGAIGQGGITRTIIGVSGAVQAIGIARSLVGVSSALQAIGVARPIVGVSAATKQIGLTREISGVSVALAQTVSRTLTPISSAVQATVSRTLVGISSSVTLRSTRPLTGISGAVKAFGVARQITGILGAIGVAGITKTVTDISASVYFEGMVYTYITVVGARGNITSEGTRGNITVEGARGTITVQED